MERQFKDRRTVESQYVTESQRHEPAQIVIAVPVAPTDARERLRDDTDETIGTELTFIVKSNTLSLIASTRYR